jgi:DNA-binding response OmpR family regulator
MTQKVLIVEDDVGLSMGLRDNLEIEGYAVECADTLHKAKSLVDRFKPSLVLLDLMLPDGDGIVFCRNLRQENHSIRIIVLTARGEDADKLLGFEVGADDYIVKPFNLRELLARIKAQLRHLDAQGNFHHPVAIGMAQVDFRRHILTRDNIAIETSAREFDLMQYLVLHKNQVVSRDMILHEVWGHSGDITTRTIDNFIVRLRRKIEPDPLNPRYLLTIHGTGYKLVG